MKRHYRFLVEYGKEKDEKLFVIVESSTRSRAFDKAVKQVGKEFKSSTQFLGRVLNGRWSLVECVRQALWEIVV